MDSLLQNLKALADAFRAFLSLNDHNPYQMVVVLLCKPKNESSASNKTVATNKRPVRSNNATPGGALQPYRQLLFPTSSPSRSSIPNEHAKDFGCIGSESSAGGDEDFDVNMRNV